MARDTILVASLSAAVCTTSLLFVSGHPLFSYPVVDAAWHHGWAARVASGDILAYAPFFRAPLYPWLLGLAYAVFGGGAFTGPLLSTVLTATGTVLFHRLALRMMDRWWALAAALVWAFWGMSVFYSGQLLIEPLFVTLLLSSLFLLTRPGGGGVWGWLLLGLASVARPTALLLVPVAWWVAGRPRPWRMLPLLGPVAAVWLCNILAGDPGTVISSQGGINLYIGNAAGADGRTAFAPVEVSGLTPPEERDYWDNVHLASRMAFPDIHLESAVSSRWTTEALAEFAADPIGRIGLMGSKLLYLVSPTEIPSNYDPYYYRGLSPVLAVLLQPPPAAFPWLILWLLLPGALAARGRGSRASQAAGLFGAILAAGTLLFFITARFRLPAVPFLLLWLFSRVSRAPGRALVLAPIGAAAGLVLGLLTAGTVRTSGVNMPFHDALAHMEAGQYQRSEQLFLMAVDRSMERDDIDLNGADAMYDLGLMAARRGDLETAASWWTFALNRRPGFLQAEQALEALDSLDPGGPSE